MFNSKLLYLPALLLVMACHSATENKLSTELQVDVSNNQDITTTFVSNEYPQNIIFLIGDGMGLAQITAGLIAQQKPLALERCRHIGLVKTNSTKLITDSAASATAMATGQKTYNGAISMDVHQNKLKTIVEHAEENAWQTGIVTTATVTHATPACFYGHQPTRANVNRLLAAEFLTKGIEVLMGGGWNYFKDGPEGRDLIAEAQELGYYVSDNLVEMGDYIPQKMLCLISPQLPPRLNERGDFLPKATLKSLNILAKETTKPFFLVVEGGQIDWGGHENESEYIIEEMLDFDKAIEHALDFAEKDGNTLVVITADHETGGYSVNGVEPDSGKIKGAFTTDYHTACMVPIFAYGPGASSFTGIMDNTEIFFKMKHLMQLKVQ